ncbi:tRNA pseudouridine(38-40) synthase TruA [Algibacter sp. L4_22]|uniref:tRNA pseudouridine(38-40) synthase TruA n=1 Tax=Algibacter sp. L4_22 TaxID=2942477 RepID=UPI00201B5B0D|nr:tRNA pseudouridine(38-40) synthase TruA [Algibacter sp. L4_22]MCL5129539.1 tRNA pseudouridine(38-40) synthase TruA [Algibacter sp. L4_22]
MRYFIELSYNGAAYHGWQIQPDAISIQEVLEKSLSLLLNTPISIMGAGRTDTGVHAKQMFAHFDFEGVLDEVNLAFRLNSFLPQDVAIHDVFKVKKDAHTRFNALSRTYLYRVALQKDVFSANDAYYVKQKLDIEKMKEAAKILLDYNDFQCFSKTKTNVKTYLCNIMKAEWTLVDGELHFIIKADRFLRNMVRAIVGTIINIGLDKISVEDLHRIIESKNRSKAGFSVPAHGLYLIEVEYPEDIKI